MQARYRNLSGFWQGLFIAQICVGLFFVIHEIFHLRLLGLDIMDNSYLYLLLSFFLSTVFLLFPVRRGAAGRGYFVLDVVAYLLALGMPLYFAPHGFEFMYRGWDFYAPADFTIMAVIMWVLIVEAVRRTTGLVLAAIITFFSLYPLFAPFMPSILEGYGRTFGTTAAFHLFSIESVLSIPIKTFGQLIIGFMIFGVALQATGGGTFLLNLALALFGWARGGPAKVAVIASALFGTMSGSVISNVITTGTITIPLMKRTGYPPHYAAAIEACASTGGCLMPPVMGTTAFVMASFLSRPYSHIVLAAMIPSVLFYLGLFVQIDGYAASHDIKGLPKSQLPSLRKTLKEGWFYLFALLVLIYLLFAVRREAQAPFYATAILVLLAALRKDTRLNVKKSLELISNVGKFLAELVAIMAGIGMILGSLSLTGVAPAFARELVHLAGGNPALILVFGALASFVLGLGMTVTACYIFLAIVLAPALTTVGFNVLAVHMYVMYWGMISFITPPVAMATYPAATIAGTSPMKVGMTASRLAAVIYILPFLFVYDPALVAQANIGPVIYAFATAGLGVWLMGSAIQCYAIGIGRLDVGFARGYPARIVLLAAGVLLAWSGVLTDLVGLALALLALVPLKLVHRSKAVA